jgi:hypothetical protein
LLEIQHVPTFVCIRAKNHSEGCPHAGAILMANNSNAEAEPLAEKLVQDYPRDVRTGRCSRA